MTTIASDGIACTRATTGAREDLEPLANAFRTDRERLVRWALRRLNDDDEAEDVVQEAFLAAIDRWDGFQQRAAVSTWLHSIVQHKAIDRLRSVRSRRQTLCSAEEADRSVEEVADEGEGPEEQLTSVEFQETLKRVANELGPRDRRLLLDYLEEKTPAQAATEQEIAADTYRVQRHRMFRSLRPWFEGLAGSGPRETARSTH